MNALQKRLQWISHHKYAHQSKPTHMPLAGAIGKSAATRGSYGRGSYAGQSTYDCDFCIPGSYGRGSYADRDTSNLDFSSQGSYGRGIYAGHSTGTIDFDTHGRIAGARR